MRMFLPKPRSGRMFIETTEPKMTSPLRQERHVVSVAHKWAQDSWDDVLVAINIALLTELRRAISQLCHAAVAPVFDPRPQHLNRERRRMLFAS